MKKDRNIVWVYPSEDPTRCPIRLVDKYISLLPEVTPKTKKFNFYLRSLEKSNLAQWYGEQVVGHHSLTKVAGELLKECGGFFSNHSLCRTSTTRLFQAGVDRKVIKEFTGHVSDAVDKYQITSEAQKESLSKIIGGEMSNVEPVKNTNVTNPNLEVTLKDKNEDNVMSCMCSCNKRSIKLQETEKLGSMINNLISSHKSGKATIKIEIEFSQ